MKEVHYHSWLSNPVMVKKHDGSWRMCVDFKDLNKACLKDGYPLPEIDWKVESLCGYPFKCFLDAYKGYHQIKMAEEDEEKTAFITSQGIFCYSKMLFGLKNAGATYQRLVDRAFQKVDPDGNLESLCRCLMEKSMPFSNPEEVYKEDAIFNGIRKPNRGPRRYQMSLNDRKGGHANASVLYELRPTRDGDQLHPHGKTGVSLAQRKQAAEKILSDTHNYCNHRSADKETAVKLRSHLKFPAPKPSIPEELPKPWTLFTDGSSCIDGFGADLILTNQEGVEFTYAMRFRFEATNNEAKYEALIADLRIAKQMGMVQYLEKAKKLTSNFKEFSIKQVPLRENKKADALSKIAFDNASHILAAYGGGKGHTWMNTICEYLIKEILPKDKKKARAVRRKASKYVVINGTLYKKSFLGPWLRCVRPLQANYILREIHEGSCSMHSGLRSVVAKAIKTGYYWPTMHTDAQKLIRECNDCEVHYLIPRNPQQNLTPITSP
ncbi:reverse transcriptase domain-containing protein [Tanacetum coccineum]